MSVKYDEYLIFCGGD